MIYEEFEGNEWLISTAAMTGHGNGRSSFKEGGLRAERESKFLLTCSLAYHKNHLPTVWEAQTSIASNVIVCREMPINECGKYNTILHHLMHRANRLFSDAPKTNQKVSNGRCAINFCQN